MNSVDVDIIRIIKILAEGSTEVVAHFVISDVIYNSIELRKSGGYQINRWDFDEMDMEYQTINEELTRTEKVSLLHQLENML